MPTIGTIAVNLHVVDRDETVYVTGANSVSHTDKVALRRTEEIGRASCRERV